MGDGRYFASMGKDQTVRLWDLRKLSTGEKRHAIPASAFGLSVDNSRWDYRSMDYPSNRNPTDKSLKHPFDNCVNVFTGPKVKATLIKCYFSPLHTTGGRYIYTGSADGNVYIFDTVLGKRVCKLKLDLDGEPSTLQQIYQETVVRDVCWHPELPHIIASSWAGKLYCFEFKL